jgi:hypothetical protein
MAWQRDLAALIKGLEKVGQALAQTQQKEIARKWNNSSIRTAVKTASVRVEENVSNIITKPPDLKVTKTIYVYPVH